MVSEAGKAVAMSYDHKPTDAAEHSRIVKVGVPPALHVPAESLFQLCIQLDCDDCQFVQHMLYRSSKQQQGPVQPTCNVLQMT